MKLEEFARREISKLVEASTIPEFLKAAKQLEEIASGYDELEKKQRDLEAERQKLLQSMESLGKSNERGVEIAAKDLVSFSKNHRVHSMVAEEVRKVAAKLKSALR